MAGNCCTAADAWAIVASAAKIEPGSGKLPIEALEVVLSELEKSSQPSSARPDYPVRVRRDEL